MASKAPAAEMKLMKGSRSTKKKKSQTRFFAPSQTDSMISVTPSPPAMPVRKAVIPMIGRTKVDPPSMRMPYTTRTTMETRNTTAALDATRGSAGCAEASVPSAAS